MSTPQTTNAYIVIASAERHLSGPDRQHPRKDNRVEAAVFPNFAAFEAGHEPVKSFWEPVGVDLASLEGDTGGLSTIEQAVEAHQAIVDAREASLEVAVDLACHHIYVSDASRTVTIHYLDDGTQETITLRARRKKRNA